MLNFKKQMEMVLYHANDEDVVVETYISDDSLWISQKAMEGKTQTTETNFYNLDAIISVGYRVNSQKATQFRIWATSILKEYMLKGFAMDDERLKQANSEYEIFNRTQSIDSDFDKFVKELEEK